MNNEIVLVDRFTWRTSWSPVGRRTNTELGAEPAARWPRSSAARWQHWSQSSARKEGDFLGNAPGDSERGTGGLGQSATSSSCYFRRWKPPAVCKCLYAGIPSQRGCVIIGCIEWSTECHLGTNSSFGLNGLFWSCKMRSDWRDLLEDVSIKCCFYSRCSQCSWSQCLLFLLSQMKVGSRDSSRLHESNGTSGGRRSRPLLGYDWIAGAAFSSWCWNLKALLLECVVL